MQQAKNDLLDNSKAGGKTSNPRSKNHVNNVYYKADRHVLPSSVYGGSMSIFGV